MTNLEKLKQLYQDKTKAGLVHVSFSFTDNARTATAEQLAGEVLLMEEAIQSGNFKEADFGDYSLIIPHTGIGPINKQKQL